MSVFSACEQCVHEHTLDIMHIIITNFDLKKVFSKSIS